MGVIAIVLLVLYCTPFVAALACGEGTVLDPIRQVCVVAGPGSPLFCYLQCLLLSKLITGAPQFSRPSVRTQNNSLFLIVPDNGEIGFLVGQVCLTPMQR